MVIVCPECSTKFRVKPDRIPESGAKVRCARCKYIFLVDKPTPQPPIEPAAEPSEPPSETEQLNTGEQPISSEQDFPQQPVAPASQESAEAGVATNPEEGFSYEKFRELDQTKGADEDDENFRFGDEAAEKASQVETDDEATITAGADEDFSFSGPTETAEPEAEADTVVEKAASLVSASDEPAVETADSIPTGLEAEPELESELEPEEEIPLTPPAPAAPKSGFFASLLRILLLLILALVIIGGALYFINGPEKIQQTIQQIFGQQFLPDQSERIVLSDLEGKFINNQDAGELFVIRGEAINNYQEPRAAIQVKAVIFDANGEPLLQKTIFCGNPISDQELQTLPFAKLEEMMRNQFGKSLVNMQVNSKESIPFVIAFNNLPKNLSEFSVDVTSSEPVDQ